MCGRYEGGDGEEAPAGPGDDARLCADGCSGPGCRGPVHSQGQQVSKVPGVDILTGKLLLTHKRLRDYYCTQAP